MCLGVHEFRRLRMLPEEYTATDGFSYPFYWVRIVHSSDPGDFPSIPFPFTPSTTKEKPVSSTLRRLTSPALTRLISKR